MAFIQFAVLSAICSLSLAVLAPMDDFSKKTLDDLVRKQLLFQILHSVNNTIMMQTQMKDQCERAINTTIDQCNACAKAHQQKGSGNVMQAVLPYLLQPALETGKFLESAEGSVVDAVSFLGDSGKKFVNDVGSVATHAGESLLDGASDIVNGAVGGLKDFGDQLAGVAGGLGHGLETVGGQIASGTIDFGAGVGHEFEHIGETLSSGANTALHGISDLGHSIEHAGSSVGHAISDIGHSIGSIFGKRRRRSVCPTCDKLDTETHSSEQIVAAVCGADNVRKQNEISANLAKMKKIYEFAVKNPVVQKVEYDPASIDVSHGVAFRTVFITYSFGQSIRYQSGIPVQLTNIPATADGLKTELYNRG